MTLVGIEGIVAGRAMTHLPHPRPPRRVQTSILKLGIDLGAEAFFSFTGAVFDDFLLYRVRRASANRVNVAFAQKCTFRIHRA